MGVSPATGERDAPHTATGTVALLMNYEINETHDPSLKSWIESANDPNTDFPIQNLPFCYIDSHEFNCYREPAVRIGDQYFRIAAAVSEGLFDGMPPSLSSEMLDKVVFGSYRGIDGILRLGTNERAALRRGLMELLARGPSWSPFFTDTPRLYVGNEDPKPWRPRSDCNSLEPWIDSPRTAALAREVLNWRDGFKWDRESRPSSLFYHYRL